MKVFYHDDLDGHCAGAIVRYKFFQELNDSDMISINYGYSFPWDVLEDGETVYMVDFALQPFDQMVELSKRVDLVWIDHHVSAIEDAKNFEFVVPGLARIDDGAGCALTWQYLNPGLDMPLSVDLTSLWDTWMHDVWDTVPFFYGMQVENTDPKDNFQLWFDLFDNRSCGLLDDIIDYGQMIALYVKKENERFARSCAFDIQFEGMTWIAANANQVNSKLFDSVYDPAEYHGMLSFGWKGSFWTVSLYTDRDDVDVSVICKKYGGGGHKGAGGFQCQELPFNIKDQR